MNFLVTFTTTLIMLAYCLPAFLLIKTKLVKKEAISAFATVLMYICQPALTFYSFNQIDIYASIFKNIGIFFAITLLLQLFIILIMYFIFRKKKEIKYRISMIASCFGNVAFFGVPLLSALFPDNPELIIYTTAFFTSMNIIAWTVGSYCISGDKKYISIKKLILNPAIISLLIALPLFIFKIKIPLVLNDFVTILSKMTTPMCMFVLGMRLATMDIKKIFLNGFSYIVIFIKQIIMPLLCFAIVYFLPIDALMKQVLVVLCACPIASVVLNFSEMLGAGQEESAELVLLGTILSIITLPLITLII